MFVGYVMFLVAAKEVSLSWFFACLFLGCIAWPFFCIAHFSRAWKPLAISFVGNILAAIGCEILFGP